jgi:hypothetical protein
MKVYTTLDTMSDAWIILDDLGLGDMLVGKTVAFEGKVLLNALLRERKLHEFLACITHEDPAAMGGLDLAQSAELLTAFFVNMADALKGWPALRAEIGAQAAPPKPAPKPKQK